MYDKVDILRMQKPQKIPFLVIPNLLNYLNRILALIKTLKYCYKQYNNPYSSQSF